METIQEGLNETSNSLQEFVAHLLQWSALLAC